jgi:hypothetical protein
MPAIALSLVMARETFWDPLSDAAKEQLYAWLSSIEKRRLPANNWHFFRILVCAAFRRLGLPVDRRAETESFDLIESCYRDEGWYQDGGGGSFDFYNPMGFHYYGLLYAHIAGKRDPERAARYVERAKLFAPHFARWFAEDGMVIPYGRSLTYRFGPAAFFSACAFAGVEALPWGVMKKITLGNLRRWFSFPILDSGGILSVGCAYPNPVMADYYNSPGSPYWGLKAFLPLALGSDHPFWQAEEAPPADWEKIPGGAEIIPEKIPGFIVTRTAEDAQILTAAAKIPPEMNHAAQKYGKFAYSARAGFCVSISPRDLERAACDSALLLSDDGDVWRERRGALEYKTGENWVLSVWKPWNDVTVATVLASLGNWHVRIHFIESARPLRTAEGGFSLRRFNGFDQELPVRNTAPDKTEARAEFPWGVSRIVALEPDAKREGSIVVPAPNLNVMYPVVVVPVLLGGLPAGSSTLACAVRLGESRAANEKPPRIDIPPALPVDLPANFPAWKTGNAV